MTRPDPQPTLLKHRPVTAADVTPADHAAAIRAAATAFNAAVEAAHKDGLHTRLRTDLSLGIPWCETISEIKFATFDGNKHKDTPL